MASPPRTSRRRRAIALAATAATGLAGTAVLLSPTASSASSHREAPAVSSDAEVDGTDVYAFVSPDDDDTVTLAASFWPFEEPDGGPNFYKFADDGSVYDINIDNDGDAVADIVYRWTFTGSYRNEDTFLYNTGPVSGFDDPDLNFRQTYDLVKIEDGVTTSLLNDAPVAPSNVGPASMPDYPAIRQSTLRDVPGGGQSFAGQSDDAFFLDLRVFDLLYGGDFSETGVDTLDGYNVQSLALQVPKSALALAGDATANPVIGMWSTTSRPTTRVLPATDAAEFTLGNNGDTSVTQVSRLGNPLVNEVVIPIRDKDRFNASQPVDDPQFLDYVTNPEVPRLIEAIYGVPAPETPRNDLVQVFLTGVPGVNSLEVNEGVATAAPGEMLRLNMTIPPTANPNRLGVIGGDNAGFPNGRRLVDDVVDIALQVVEGELVGAPNDLGDAVDANDVAFLDAFPYFAQPHQRAVNRS